MATMIVQYSIKIIFMTSAASISCIQTFAKKYLRNKIKEIYPQKINEQEKKEKSNKNETEKVLR